MQCASVLFTHSLQAALSRDDGCLHKFIAPKLWLPNITDFNAVDYRICTVLREWVFQQLVRDVDELIDTWSSIQQTVIDQTIDQW